MARKRDLKLDKYNIGVNTYRELLYFCRQYYEKKARISEIYALGAAALSGMPKGTGVAAPTEKKALLAVKLSKDCDMIERAAKLADEEIYEYIIANVVHDKLPYEYLAVPSGRERFYKSRRKFFYYLAREKGLV